MMIMMMLLLCGTWKIQKDIENREQKSDSWYFTLYVQ